MKFIGRQSELQLLKREYEALVEKAGSPAFSSNDVAGLCLFSKTGFDSAIIESLASDKCVHLFNECRLVRD